MILKSAIYVIITKRKYSIRIRGHFAVMFTLHEIYDLAIQIEKNGEEFFREAEKKVSNPSLKILFQWLADQEVRHREWFIRRKASSLTGSAPFALDEMSGKMLQDILGSQRFSLAEVDVKRVGTMESLLSIALEFEEDTIIFFRMLRSLLEDDESLRGIDEIIEEENRHIQALENYREEGDQELTGIKGKPDGGNKR